MSHLTADEWLAAQKVWRPRPARGAGGRAMTRITCHVDEIDDR